MPDGRLTCSAEPLLDHACMSLLPKRIGVTDYLALVNEKLNTARDLYESMVNEFHQGRAFFLELLVVIILIIEIVFLFVGKIR